MLYHVLAINTLSMTATVGIYAEDSREAISLAVRYHGGRAEDWTVAETLPEMTYDEIIAREA